MTTTRFAIRMGMAFAAGMLVATVFYRIKLAESAREARGVAHVVAPKPESYGEVADFSLIDQKGRSFKRFHLEGKYWVAGFVFTRCQGPCPLITNKMADLQRKWPAQKKLHFVSFSVDPDYDTPDRLKTYAAAYKADESNWSFLTGDKEAIHQLIHTSFHLAVAPGASPMDILHSVSLVLVDPQGKIVGYYNSSDSAAMAQLETDLTQRLG